MEDQRMKIGTVVFVLLFLFACVPTKTWISTPSTQQVQNVDFSAGLTPLKRDKNHFVSFRLLLTIKRNRI